MEKALVITDKQGLELAGRLATLDEDEKALLQVWCFHKQPPRELVIFVDSDYQYGFTKFGDRIGLADYWGCSEKGDIYFHGDNGVTYRGSMLEGKNLRFSVKVMDHCIEKLEHERKKFLDLLPTN